MFAPLPDAQGKALCRVEYIQDLGVSGYLVFHLRDISRSRCESKGDQERKPQAVLGLSTSLVRSIHVEMIRRERACIEGKSRSRTPVVLSLCTILSHLSRLYHLGMSVD
jgi:hypothetical protein